MKISLFLYIYIMKIIFIDTDTTGFDDNRNDIVQIAGLVTENKTILESFNYRCKPVNWKAISKDALKVTGLTIEQLKTYPEPRLAFEGLKSVFDKYVVKGQQRYIIAGQNVKAFDWRFLASFWNKHKTEDETTFDYYFRKNVCYDLMDLTRPLKNAGLFKIDNVKLGTIMEALNVKVDGHLHDALTDIKGTFDSFYKMVDKWKELEKAKPKFIETNANDHIKHLFRNI